MRHVRMCILAALCVAIATLGSAQTIPSPEDHFGHQIGADRKLVHWDGIVEYMQLVAERSGRVKLNEVGKTTLENPFLLMEISSEDTIANLDRYKELQRSLYFRSHNPGQDPASVHTEQQLQELLDQHKAVVLITCSIHATEVGAAQMSLELVHQLATSNDPKVGKILDNVILLLVPSLNPDGLNLVAEWYDKWVGTDHEAAPTPWLYHPYVGHDNNRDMYMYTQAETRRIGEVLYKDWFPSVWLDMHQMGNMGARIFVMPATDPINNNVHPLIYRWNGIYGQAQAAALEAAGKVGIVYDESYTNFWVGAMAWTGWWHNQVGMLTELASVRTATPVDQKMAKLGASPSGSREDFRRMRRQMMENPDAPLPAPYDAQPRTNYPRPWLGGKWTLRDIVEYDWIAAFALLETAADTRRQLNAQIFEVNYATIAQFMKGQAKGSYDETMEKGGYISLPEAIRTDRSAWRVMDGATGAAGTPYAVIIPTEQHDVPTAHKMMQLLELGGVKIEKATAEFEADGKTYPAGTHVIRLAQVFGRYAKDMLGLQAYPEISPDPSLPARPPYDVTAWSLGMLMGVKTQFIDEPFEAQLELIAVQPPEGGVVGNGNTFLIDAAYNDAFKVANRLFESRARIRRAQSSFRAGSTRMPAGTWVIQNIGRQEMDSLAKELGLTVQAVGNLPRIQTVEVRRPRIAVYQPWTSNMDEGWTRWLIEDFDFEYTTLHPQDFRAAGSGDTEKHQVSEDARADWPAFVRNRAPEKVQATALAERFDVIVFTQEDADDIVKGMDYKLIPPDYRGGIGEEGIEALRDFVDSGGTIVALGTATELFTKHWPIPVRDVTNGLDQNDFLIPGSILNFQTDPSHPLAWGMPRTLEAYFARNPVFTLTDSFRSQNASVAARYPNQDLRASGWVRGPEHIAGRAASVQVDLEGGGRIVLLGLRAQHRAQTHATYKLFFNALMMSSAGRGPQT